MKKICFVFMVLSVFAFANSYFSITSQGIGKTKELAKKKCFKYNSRTNNNKNKLNSNKCKKINKRAYSFNI